MAAVAVAAVAHVAASRRPRQSIKVSIHRPIGPQAAYWTWDTCSVKQGGLREKRGHCLLGLNYTCEDVFDTVIALLISLLLPLLQLLPLLLPRQRRLLGVPLGVPPAQPPCDKGIAETVV